MGLVVADVGRFIVGVPIHSVAHILIPPQRIPIPRPRPGILGLFLYENQLLPIIDLRQRLEGRSTGESPYCMIVREKDITFAFPIGYIESISQIPAQRIRYPRHEEIAVDKKYVRGFWDFAARRHGYIINCSAVYTDLFAETAQATQAASVEDLA